MLYNVRKVHTCDKGDILQRDMVDTTSCSADSTRAIVKCSLHAHKTTIAHRTLDVMCHGGSGGCGWELGC